MSEPQTSEQVVMFETGGTSDDSDEWYTPRWVFESLGVEFDLDPASPGKPPSIVPAKRHITKEENGLATSWSGTVWLNPPFSSKYLWVQRMIRHGNGILLIPADPSGQTAHLAMRHSDSTSFIEGSVGFTRGDGNPHGSPGFGVMLCSFGASMTEVLQVADGPFTKMKRYAP